MRGTLEAIVLCVVDQWRKQWSPYIARPPLVLRLVTLQPTKPVSTLMIIFSGLFWNGNLYTMRGHPLR